jgi:hypothetical protein
MWRLRWLCHFQLAPNLFPNMSGNLDFTRVPTASEITRVKDEIHMTEKKIEMLKAWIAPIRRLNTDILSLIFEMCGEDDWTTPLQISATSREWRNLILATPRAWEFLPVGDCEDIETAKLFLERSHPRPLHLDVPYDYYVLLSSISQRLECLTLDCFDDTTELSFPKPFPKLKRIVFADEGDVQLSCIDASRFPALRHLRADFSTPLIDGDLLNLPPLQSLLFTFDDDSCWLRVLQACQDTLISLQFTIDNLLTDELPTTIPKPQLVFPRLICLGIEDRGKHYGESPLDLKTPVLETYIEQMHYGPLMRPDAKTVTQLRTNEVPEPLAFPKVKLVQFRGQIRASSFLYGLTLHPAYFPELERIEVESTDEVPDDMVKMVAAVNRKRELAISLDFTSRFRDLRGMVKTQLVSFASMRLSSPITDIFQVWLQHAMLS